MSKSGFEKVLNNLECALSKDNHILNAPIPLECGDTACKKCILTNQNKQLKCNKCLKEIKISSIIPNESVIIKNTIESHLDRLYSITYQRLNESVNKLKESNKVFDEHVELKFEAVESEVNAKIESLKSQLDQISIDFKNDLNLTKNYIKNSTVSSNMVKNYETSLENLKKELNDNDQNDTKQLYEYQEKWQEINAVIENISKYNVKLKFQRNNNEIDKMLVGCLISDLSVKNNIQNVDHMLIELDFNPYNLEMHPNGSALIAADHINSRLLLFNNDFKQIEVIDKINGKTFMPLGITTNKDDRIYICDHENKCVLMTDLDFKYVNSIYKGRANNDGSSRTQQIPLKDPYDVCFYNQSIYVCDAQTAQIQKYSSNELKFEHAYEVSFSPCQIKINCDTACVRAYNEESINFYNLKNNFSLIRTYNNQNGVICNYESLFFQYNHKNSIIECFDSTGNSIEQLATNFSHVPFHKFFGLTIFDGKLVISAERRFVVIRIYEAFETIRNESVFNVNII